MFNLLANFDFFLSPSLRQKKHASVHYKHLLFLNLLNFFKITKPYFNLIVTISFLCDILSFPNYDSGKCLDSVLNSNYRNVSFFLFSQQEMFFNLSRDSTLTFRHFLGVGSQRKYFPKITIIIMLMDVK